jgi:hypothetical protein
MRSRSIVLCFGGECPERGMPVAQLAVSECDHGRCCDPELAVPQPMPADEHHEHRSGCTDIELTVADLTMVRTASLAFPVLQPAMLPLTSAWQVEQPRVESFATGTRPDPWSASPLGASMAALRAVRIQV